MGRVCKVAYLKFIPSSALRLRDGGPRGVGVALHVLHVLGLVVVPLELSGQGVVGGAAELNGKSFEIRITAQLKKRNISLLNLPQFKYSKIRSI
jgi:hypothetical protein